MDVNKGRPPTKWSATLKVWPATFFLQSLILSTIDGFYGLVIEKTIPAHLYYTLHMLAVGKCSCLVGTFEE